MDNPIFNIKGLGEKLMWYVIQTLGGKEEETADMIQRAVSPYYIEECFIPKRERIKKFHGVWNREEEVLFKGYVFTVSRSPEELYQALKQIPRMTKILGREGQFFFPLNEEDEKFVKRIGDEKHKTSISKIEVKEGKKIRVIEGPLKDYIGDVTKVDLHKREVVVHVGFMGRPLDLKMGIEMVNACV